MITPNGCAFPQLFQTTNYPSFNMIQFKKYTTYLVDAATKINLFLKGHGENLKIKGVENNQIFLMPNAYFPKT